MFGKSAILTAGILLATSPAQACMGISETMLALTMPGHIQSTKFHDPEAVAFAEELRADQGMADLPTDPDHVIVHEDGGNSIVISYGRGDCIIGHIWLSADEVQRMLDEIVGDRA